MTTTLTDVQAQPWIWSYLDSDDRARIKREAMDTALDALEAEGRKMALAMKAAACPAAERIAAANTRAPLNMIDALFRHEWSAEFWKRDAAEAILRIRSNRAALGHASPAMTASLLGRAARSRRKAAEMKMSTRRLP